MSHSQTASIRTLTPNDIETWAAMRNRLWPDSIDVHRQELAAFFRGDFPLIDTGLGLVLANGQLVGFAELSIRSHVDSVPEANIPYLEGWFVEPEFRNQGLGLQLMEAAQQWAKDQGANYFASDVECDNEGSINAHKRFGFEAQGCSIGFLKRLN